MISYPILFGIGAVLFLTGAYLVVPVAPVRYDYSVSIDLGGYYYEISFDIQRAGRISGEFSEASGLPVSFYVFDQPQYTAYQTSPGIPVGLFSSTEVSSGTYSARVSLPGKYYLVLAHGVAYEQSSQQVHVVVNIDGINLLYLGAGLAVIGVGTVLWLAAYDSRRRAHLQPWF